jgi:hypothetical protein
MHIQRLHSSQERWWTLGFALGAGGCTIHAIYLSRELMHVISVVDCFVVQWHCCTFKGTV